MDGELETLPIFPLSNVVLFPRLQVPLHVFELRYRQMTEHLLAADRRLGMVVVRPEHAGGMEGDPPVFEIGCAGNVTRARRLDDGRYDIVVLGTHRFRIVDEPSRRGERLYRVARVERLEDAAPEEDRPRVAALRARVIELVGDLVRQAPSRPAKGLSRQLLEGFDDATLVNALSNAFALPPNEKQILLEADSIAERYARLEGALCFLAALGNAPGAPDPGTVH